ncbi:MAG: hypothetical protein HYZ75_09475 [Elusimicrobia bacterium]|nr:hypothetical protein [Elusimicrobiota bacterium]
MTRGKIALLVVLLLCGAAFLVWKQGKKLALDRYKAALAEWGQPVLRDPGEEAKANAAEIFAAVQAMPKLAPEEAKAAQAALRAPWTDDDGSLAAVMTRMAPAMELMRKAAELDRFDAAPPRLEKVGVATPLPVITVPMQTLALLLLEARRAQAEGRLADAAADAAAVLSTAALLEREENFPLWGILASAVAVQNAYPTVAALLSDPRTPRPSYELLRAPLAALAASDSLRDALAHQLVAPLETTALMIDHLLWTVPGAKRQALIADYRLAWAKKTAAALDAAGKLHPSDLDAVFADATRKSEGHPALLSCPQRPGEFGPCVVAHPFVPYIDYTKYLDIFVLRQARAALLLAGATLRQRELARGGRMSAEVESIPEPGAERPADPYADGELLRFAAEPTLWAFASVGPDRKADGALYPADDAGAGADWRKPAAGDLVLALPRFRFAPPARPKPAPRAPRRKR